MQAAVHPGGLSGRSLAGPATTQQLKSSAEIAVPSPYLASGKGRKRDRAEQNVDTGRCERSLKSNDHESNPLKGERSMKSDEIHSFVNKDGGLVDLAGVDRLLRLMQHDQNDGMRKAADVTSRRTVLATVIAATDLGDCLNGFVKQGGLAFMDEWLQEAHKGKAGDGGSPREGERAIENLLLTLLHALERLPIDLVALKTCSVGKSVNNLRSHKNLEIQKRARRLVESWKKRVDAEMKLPGESKPGSTQGMSWPAKPSTSDPFHPSFLKGDGPSEVAIKNSRVLASNEKSASNGLISMDLLSKGDSTQKSGGKAFSSTSSIGGAGSKESHTKVSSSSPPDTPCSNSFMPSWFQPARPNGQVKSTNSSWKDDGKIIPSFSLHSKPTPPGCHSHMLPGKSHVVAGQNTGVKEAGFGKPLLWSRNEGSEKMGNAASGLNKGAAEENVIEGGNSHRLIVRIPNPGRSPVRTASGGALVESPVPSSRSSSPSMADTHAHLGLGDAVEPKSRSQMSAQAASSPEGFSDVISNLSTDKDQPCFISKTGELFDCDKKQEEEGSKCQKSDDCSQTKAQLAASNRDAYTRDLAVHVGDCKQLEVSVMLCEEKALTQASSSLDLATVGINLLASVAAREGAMDDRNNSALEKSYSILAGTVGSQEDKSGCCQRDEKRESLQATDRMDASQSVSEKEQHKGLQGHFSDVSLSGGKQASHNSNMDEKEMTGRGPPVGHVYLEESMDPDESFQGQSCLTGSTSTSNLSISQPPAGTKVNIKHLSLPVENPLVDESASNGLSPLEAPKGNSSDSSAGNHSWTKERMGEKPKSGVSVVGEYASCGVNAMDDSKTYMKIDEVGKTSSRTKESDYQSESETALRFLGEDALEVARQVAKEVEQEMESYRKISSETEIFDAKSVHSHKAAQIKETGESASSGNPSRSSDRSDGSRVQGSAVQSLSEAIVAPRFDTVHLNLNNDLDGNPDIVDSKAVGQGPYKPENSLLERKNAGACGGERANASGSSPSSPRQTFQSLAPSSQISNVLSAPSQQVLKPVARSSIAGGSAASEKYSKAIAATEIARIADTAERRDFDLNEGLVVEEAPLQDDAAIVLPSSKSLTAPIATKGLFIPSASPLRIKGELGWKGSAATSAFRPAEPRRTPETQPPSAENLVSSSGINAKQNRPLLDFDLNVADERVLEDAGTASTLPSRGASLDSGVHNSCLISSQTSVLASTSDLSGPGKIENSRKILFRPVLDLNRVDESEEGGTVLASDFKSAEWTCLQDHKSCSTSLAVKTTMLDFDLNDGPSIDYADDPITLSGTVRHHPETSVQFVQGPRVTGEGMNDEQWSHMRNPFPAVAIPAFTSLRAEPPYPVSTSQSFLNATPTAGPFHCDIYRPGAAFSSSAIAYPTLSPAAFPYTGFPFGFNSASFPTVSAPFLDSSGPTSFPAVPAQMLSSGAVVPSYVRPPFLMGVSEVTGPTNNGVWSRPALDLNSGPDAVETDPREDRLNVRQLSSHSSLEEQKRVLHQVVVAGQSLKRKEPEGGWGMQRPVFKQPTWR